MDEDVIDKFEVVSCRLRKKVSWVGAGVIVACLTVVALLTYDAYSGEQKRQREEIAETSNQVQELKTNVRVMQAEFSHVRSKLQDLKETQKEQFDAVMEKLERIREGD